MFRMVALEMPELLLHHALNVVGSDELRRLHCVEVGHALIKNCDVGGGLGLPPRKWPVCHHAGVALSPNQRSLRSDASGRWAFDDANGAAV